MTGPSVSAVTAHSAHRLAAVLKMRRATVTREARAETAYVFGDDIGGRTKSIKKAWETCVLKARGYEPEWSPEGNNVLPDVMRQFEQKSAKRGAVVVQKRQIDRPPLHHGKRMASRKSMLH